MGKRSTWIAVAAAALMIAGIAIAVSRLYSTGGSSPSAKKAADSILRAIPSDAVAVFVFDGSKTAHHILADSTGLLKPIISADNPALMGYLREAGKYRTAVGLLTGGSLVPLVATETDKSDSAEVATLQAAAARAGLKTALKENFLLASRSETFLGSSARHIEDGSSVLGVNNLASLASEVKGPAVAFVNHSHAGKLMQVFTTPAFRKQSAFVKDLTAWSAWSVAGLDKEGIVIEGTALPGEAAASWMHCFAGTPSQEAAFAEALPYFTGTAVSVPISDSYVRNRRSFEDGKGSLSRFDKAIRKGKPSVAEWFQSLQAKEAVLACFRSDDGVPREVILLRSSHDLKLGKEAPNPCRGAFGTLFGEYFAITDTVCSQLGSKWSVWGDLPGVRAFEKGDYTLRDRMADASVPTPSGFTVYASLSDAPECADALLSKGLASAVKAWAAGSGYAPVVASLNLEGSKPSFRISLYKRALKGTKVQVMERDTVVVVPGGLFPVKNFHTGKTNYLYQNSHNYLCLNDDKGRGVWGVPFKQPICGRVQNIDCFGNNKIQFLFAAGSSLYAIDRLGHWVNGFPAELGTSVLLGPDLYEFPEDRGYTVMVLHRDNTLERYTIRGKKASAWKGISAPETVKNLPELIQSGEERRWVVRTSVRTLVYPFEGGEPLVSGEGGKMIKPDARLELTPKGFKAECYDGKIREFKF